MDDEQLVREYAQGRSEPAFAELVRRHLPMVYAAARRQVRDEHLAQDVSQAVFLVLAGRAKRLTRVRSLAAWLYRVTWYAATRARAANDRRRRHEQQAVQESSSMRAEEISQVWSEVEPRLDAALNRLSTKDRQAVVLRYFEDRSIKEVAEALALSESATKMRLGRALGKLRGMLEGGEGMLSVPALTAAFEAKAIVAAPAGLVEKVMAGIGGGAGNGTAGLIAKGAGKMMVWAKVKVAAVLLTGVVVVAGGVTAAEMRSGAPPQAAAVTRPVAKVDASAANDMVVPDSRHGRLDFRVAVSRGRGEPAVSDNEAGLLIVDLGEHGPDAIQKQRTDVAWVPLDAYMAKDAQSLPVAGQWKGRWYMLLSNDAKHTMLADEKGRRTWGIVRAYLGKTQTGDTAVAFEVDQAGAQRFETFTSEHLRRMIASIVDDQVVAAAIVQSVIKTQGMISSEGMTEKDAADLAANIERGMPATTPPVSKPTGWEGFSSEVEVVVPAVLGDPKTPRLRLSDGKLLTPPGDANQWRRPADWNDWIKAQHIDLMAANDATFEGLMGYDMAAAPVGRELPSGVNWSNALNDLREMMKPGTPALMSAAGELPTHYAIQTRDGGMGILTIVELVDKPRGVKIRYRLLADK